MSETKTLSYIQGVQHAMRWALESRDDTIYFGEDVAIPGGPFGSTKGLYNDFGAERIFDTPISETGFLGMALGASMTGLRPIAEIMYADFFFVAFDQVVNQIANMHYASNGRLTAPLTIRTQGGYSPGACAQHSHSVEAYLAHTPGLRVAVPSSADDAYQMNRTAILSDDPVIVHEVRMLYPTKGEVRLGIDPEPMGGAKVVREGTDCTVVAWSRMVHDAVAAAEELEAEGISVEVVDLRWLAPLDFDTVAASLGRTGRLVVAHEANLTGGFGAEIAARAASDCFGDLKAPIRRVALPDLPMPAAPALQEAVVPSAKHVVEAVRNTVSH
ncbi:alpha-ketoacid dehydrogenase subunit beta [Propionibacteriaceae bacterium Y2011]|uniref:alpha-ketoacid dehydrogenase subunit beta n=1 Tax=Microlunatus sp. Y2014 TaxID=3418488 RepID=UPI003B4E7D7E